MSVRSEGRSQIALFDVPDPMREVHDAAASLARRLPEGLRFGTSSWSFPGWQGIVYGHVASEAQLAREGLREYARHPLFRTVGIDRGYYAPIADNDFVRLGAQLPEGFRCCIKAPAEITSPVIPGSDRKGDGVVNPWYLSPERYEEVMGRALREHFAVHTGVVILECPRTSPARTLRSELFCDRLAAFLAGAPAGAAYAVELREASYFTPRYVKTLRAYGASHVYNWWSAMPALSAQARAVPAAEQPHAVLRVMILPGQLYEERKRALAPFDRVRDVHPEMRSEVAEIARDALRANVPTWVLVGNKAEGCAPETVRALADILAT